MKCNFLSRSIFYTFIHEPLIAYHMEIFQFVENLQHSIVQLNGINFFLFFKQQIFSYLYYFLTHKRVTSKSFQNSVILITMFWFNKLQVCTLHGQIQTLMELLLYNHFLSLRIYSNVCLFINIVNKHPAVNFTKSKDDIEIQTIIRKTPCLF